MQGSPHLCPPDVSTSALLISGCLHRQVGTVGFFQMMVLSLDRVPSSRGRPSPKGRHVSAGIDAMEPAYIGKQLGSESRLS